MLPLSADERPTRALAAAFLIALLGIVLMGLTVPRVADAAGSAKKTRLTAVLSADQVATGRPVALTGKVRPAARRTVHLQVRRGRAWKTVDSVRSTARTGAYRLAVPTATTGTVVVRAHTPRRGRAAAIDSPARTLRLVLVEPPPCCKTNPPVTSQPVATPPATPPCCKTNPPVAPRPVTTPPATPVATPVPSPSLPVVPTFVSTPSSARPSFRALYVLAADQTPNLQKVAAIVASVRAVNGWFATQTLGARQPRWVRDASGAVTVSMVRMPRPASAYAGAAFATVTEEFEAAAPTPAGQKTVVWIDAGSPDGCGVTGSTFAVLFEAACNIHPTVPKPGSSIGDVFPYGAGYLTAHEMTHAFGAVAACAPHASGGGHVNDDPSDILYTGTQDRRWSALALDPGRDDYYATTNSACPGIETSPLWTATSDPLS